MRYGRQWGALCLVLGTAALAGCNGGGGGASSAIMGGTSRAAVFLTDSPREDFAHVWATLYHVELVPQGGGAAVVLFDDPSGRQIDLRTLRDASGERYSFLSSGTVPAGVYTSANVTVGTTMQLMKNGQATGDPLPVDSSLPLDSSGHPILSLTFKKPKTLGSGTTNIVVDFNLARFIIRDSKVLPALNEGEGTGLHDAMRHEKDEYHGTVSALSGDSPTLTFTLSRGNGQTVTVTTTASTALFGEGTLADGAVVDVTGALDPTTQTLVATQLEVRAAGASGIEAAGACTPRIEGTASEADATAGTFTLTLKRAHGLTADNTTVKVVTTATTVFRGDSGSTLVTADFFAALTTDSSVSVEGSYDTATDTLTATEVRAFDAAKDNGWAGAPHGFRDGGKGKDHWANGTMP